MIGFCIVFYRNSLRIYWRTKNTAKCTRGATPLTAKSRKRGRTPDALPEELAELTDLTWVGDPESENVRGRFGSLEEKIGWHGLSKRVTLLD